MDWTLIILIVIFGMSTALPPDKPKQYRDYEYNKKTNAFYKLHIVPANYNHAQRVCTMEGATLVLPSTKAETEQIHTMMKRFPEIGDAVYISNDGEKHDSAEETPIIKLTLTSSEELRALRENLNCEIATRDMDILSTECYNSHPYICKVEAKDAPYDPVCKVYGSGYRYYENVRSCYRVPALPLTWNEAYAECRAQGAHLAVLNSEAESNVVKELLKTVPLVTLARTTYFYFAGIRAIRTPEKRVWRTIFMFFRANATLGDETLEAAGFSNWNPGEPNNYDDNEDCGTIFSSTALYNDVSCTDQYGFVCEKEVTK